VWRYELGSELTPLELDARSNRVESFVNNPEIVLVGIVFFDFVDIDLKGQVFVGVEPDEVQDQLRLTVGYRGTYLVDPVASTQFKCEGLIASKSGVERVEEYITDAEPRDVLVSADDDSPQLRSRRTPPKRQFEQIAVRVASRVLFDINGSGLYRIRGQEATWLDVLRRDKPPATARSVLAGLLTPERAK
jgi:hypothetical protein